MPGSASNSRDDCLADQLLGVVAPVGGVGGDDHDQVQVGDDLDELAAQAMGEEAWVAVVAGHPPLVAVAVEWAARWRVALALGGGADIAGGNDLDAVPAAAIEVQVPEFGEVARGEYQPGEAAVVALRVGDPGHLGPLVGSLLGWGRQGGPDRLEGMLGVDP